MTKPLVKRERVGAELRLVISRPDVRNALNDELIASLTDEFRRARSQGDHRVIILSGEGTAFCAGADLKWMRQGLSLKRDAVEEEARRLGQLLEEISSEPTPVIAKVHGAALGGGMGLVAACDLAVAEPETVFGLTEARLGLAPAVIMPSLLRKMGRSEILSCALLAGRFGAPRAEQIGLINAVSKDTNEVTDRWIEAIQKSGPGALAAIKSLFASIQQFPGLDLFEQTAKLNAQLRCSAEGQEGMLAFFERRKPDWAA